MQGSDPLRSTLAALLLMSTCAGAQSGADALGSVTHSSSFTFLQRDGTCVYGKVSKADATSVIVQPFDKPPVTLQSGSLLQVRQGNALLYTARSSWADVSGVVVYPREKFVLTLMSGKQVKGKPVKTNSDSIALKHGLRTTIYPKAEVATIDYLRVKPPTDSFMYVLGEAPWILLFDPEFYYRSAGFAGKLQVRLYDATKPEDDTPVECRGRR